MSGSTDFNYNMMKILSTLLLGVALLRVAPVSANQSQSEQPDEQQMGTIEKIVEQRQVDTPEVVLQLKYDRGGLNRIYLAQFRKGMKHWVPSVPTRVNLCADLCHAGLGGEACGSSCEQMIPVGLQSALNSTSHTDAEYGHPRLAVCPSLCTNQLGSPLCSCEEIQEEEEDTEDVDWSAVCTVFCHEGYALAGCPSCENASKETMESSQASRVLSTYDGWSAWCNVQCRQGQGGAACNCDRAPFQ